MNKLNNLFWYFTCFLTGFLLLREVWFDKELCSSGSTFQSQLKMTQSATWTTAATTKIMQIKIFITADQYNVYLYKFLTNVVVPRCSCLKTNWVNYTDEFIYVAQVTYWFILTTYKDINYLYYGMRKDHQLRDFKVINKVFI
jgi:hypothetical protein